MAAIKATARPAEDSAEPARTRYEADPYSWAFEQAALLRAGRLDAIDAANIAEEIEDVGRAEYHGLESALRLILMHMLKWDRQPERRTRSWATTIVAQRYAAAKALRENPGLKSRLEPAKTDAYTRARLEASGETDLDLAVFPEVCPYSLDEIMTREHLWPPAEQPSPRKGRRGPRA